MPTPWNHEAMVPAAIDRHRADQAARDTTPPPPEPPKPARRRHAAPVPDPSPAPDPPAGDDTHQEATP